MRFRFESQEELYSVIPIGTGTYRVLNSELQSADFYFPEDKDLDYILPGPIVNGSDSHSDPFYFLNKNGKFYLHYKGRTFVIRMEERELTEDRSHARDIKSPMPGKLLKLWKKEGDSFEKGEVLGILEAMKMENQLKAPFDGFISKILKNEGELVNQDEILMELEPKLEN